jgi:Flp pilus assembly protein TadD
MTAGIDRQSATLSALITRATRCATRRLAAPGVLPATITALVIIAYLPALGADYVWDDDVNVVTNGALRTLSGLGRIWTDVTVTQQYYPLTHTTFWIQYQLGGLWFPAYHVVNVALHAATAVLLLFVLRRLAVQGAGLAAALFALHPLNVESVAWVTERKNVLSGALVLAACLAYLRYDDGSRAPEARDATERARQLRRWIGAFALFLLALTAKTSVATMPAALLAALALLRGRRGRALLPLVPFFATGAAAGLFTAYLEHGRVGAHGAEFTWSPAFHVLVAGRAFIFYLTKLLLPIDLAFFYPKWEIDPSAPSAWAYPVATAALFVGAWTLHRRVRAGTSGRGAAEAGPLAALVAYAALVFPALGFFNVYFMRFAYVQNHFAYLASMPVLALVGATLWRIAEARPRASLAIVGAITALTLGSVREAATFHDYETLFRAALERNPRAWVASYDLGLRLQREGKSTAAVPLFRAALAVRPEDPEIVASLGTALAEAGRVDEARAILSEAARRAPESAESHLNYAAVLDLAGLESDAAAEYRKAVRLRPDWPRPARQLAWLLATTDDPAVRDGREAVSLAESACAKTTATLARCLDTLAAAYAAAGDLERAQATEARAVALARASGGRTTAWEARADLYARGEAYVAPRR